jgi:imidazolonepropionase-like amidohydrolase
VQTGYLAPKGTDKVIDLKSKTVMPGLTDMHVHIEGETSKDQLVKRYQFNQADVAFEAARNAKTTLMAGFTSVRDLGGSESIFRFAMRSAKVLQ